MSISTLNSITNLPTIIFKRGVAGGRPGQFLLVFQFFQTWNFLEIDSSSDLTHKIQRNSLNFSNGPDDVGRWQGATFKFLIFFFLQGTSIGLAVTNHAPLSLVDTNLA